MNGSYEGLPPMMVCVSESEVLYDDSRKIAERARKAGIKVKLSSLPDAIHIYPAYFEFVEEYRESLVEICEYIKSFCKTKEET